MMHLYPRQEVPHTALSSWCLDAASEGGMAAGGWVLTWAGGRRGLAYFVSFCSSRNIRASSTEWLTNNTSTFLTAMEAGQYRTMFGAESV